MEFNFKFDRALRKCLEDKKDVAILYTRPLMIIMIA